MNTNDVTKMADAALAELNEALAAGQSESLTRYLEAMGRFHRYSFGNVMLILAQRPSATHVAGFNTWKNLGRFVKKGEKGIGIIAPVVIRKKADDVDERSGTASGQDLEGQKTLLRFRVVYVFDVEQTDGKPLPELGRAGGDPGGSTSRLKSFVSSLGIELEYRDDVAGGADGASTGGRILLRVGLSPAEEFSVLVHEVAHELLHRGPDREQTTKTVRETEAEAVAFVVSRAVGLEVGTSSSDYIQLYRGDEKTLSRSLDRVQSVAERIIEVLTAAEAVREVA